MKSTDKPVRLFRYGRAAAGLILLVNPIISLYDILPDFIGYLLLFTALREVSRLEGRMEDAQSRLIWLAAFSGLRLTLALVFYDAQSSFKLLVCFSLAVVELVTFLMWSASFFSGLEYLLNRNDGEELVGRLSNVRFLTVLFFIVRSACNLLPEFTSLLEDAAMTDLTNAARYLALAGGSRIAEGIRRLRAGEVIKSAGFDGEYGKLALFTSEELKNASGQISFLEEIAGRRLFNSRNRCRRRGRKCLQTGQRKKYACCRKNHKRRTGNCGAK